MLRTEIPSVGRREISNSQRRLAIIKVATRTFLQTGYHQTTMSGIAKQLGGSKGTLWRYFPSKELLFGAVLEAVTKDLRSMLSPTLDPAEPLDAALTSFAEKFIASITAPDAIALQRLVVAEADRFPQIGRIFYQNGRVKIREMVVNFLKLKIDAGLLSDCEPEEAADALLDLCTGGYPHRILWRVEEQSNEAVYQTAHRIARQFLCAYGVHVSGRVILRRCGL